MAVKRSRAAFEADLQRQQSPYVFFGTPLAPLDGHTRDDGSYVPVWKQEVTDERGRKRLHGAFTGGFSAGFFNTVGSKEGWAPASFVSSRSNRAKTTATTTTTTTTTTMQQRAEDYMDEEDLADAEEKKQLETKDAFAGFGSAAAGGRESSDAHHQQPQFMDLFRSQLETMGLRLLRRMGWRDGQGIGPQVRRRRKKAGLPDAEEEEEYLADPENTRLISFVRKTDSKGMGYGQTQGLAIKSVQEKKAVVERPMVAKKRGGMGIGVLNDTGSDNEDPYEMGPKLSLPRISGNDKKKKNSIKKKQIDEGRMASNPLLKSVPLFTSKKGSGFRKCHDGKLPLSGFILSTQGPISEDRKYPPPKVPEGWESALKKSGASNSNREHQSTSDMARESTLNPTARASILGETPLPGKSVFDFLTPSARDKLVVASNNPNLPAGRAEALPENEAKSTDPTSWIPRLDSSIAAAALNRGGGGSFVPYTDDPPKLARYQAFLNFHAGLERDPKTPECPAGTQREDFIKELHEFAHAATIFKPMTGAMASRFTSSSSTGPTTTTEKGNDGTGRPLLTGGGAVVGRRLPPEEEAAKAGMYGQLTRKIEPFYPSRLLCKRFGVQPPTQFVPPPPMSSESSQGTRETTAKAGAGIGGFADRFASGGVQLPDSAAESGGDGGGRRAKLEILGKRDMDELRKASGLPALGDVVRRKKAITTVDPNINEALEAERPSDETFKAIFADDD